MRTQQTLLLFACLLGATQCAWSQNKAAAVPTIPGYLNPATGDFTTRIKPHAAAKPRATGTPTTLFFREDFRITITNYDQPSSAQAVCSVSIDAGDDSELGVHADSASAIASYSGGGWTCDVPILTLWTLNTPATDVIVAAVSITIYSQLYPSIPIVLRESSQGLQLPVPANTATVENDVSFSL